MFATKRGEENENFNNKPSNPKIITETSKTNNNNSINKTILSTLISPIQKMETKKKEQNIINVERFLRYSQKFRNLKEMQKNLEKLLSKDSFLV